MMPFSKETNFPRRARGFEHLVVVQRLRQHAGRQIRDARDPEHFHAHVPRDDRFGHRGHPDGVGADRAQVADFRRRLVAGPVTARVDAVPQRRCPCAAAASSAMSRKRGE